MHAVVITSAATMVPDPVETDHLDVVVIAADGGLGAARRAGLTVHHVIGDLDSAREHDVEWAASSGASLHRHSVAKDETDLELALQLGIDLRATEITVASGHGDRFDHLLAETAVLASPRWRSTHVDAWYPPAHLDVVCGPDGVIDLDLPSGSTVSIVAMHGDARVTTYGMTWPLDDEVLPAGVARGVSNIANPAEGTCRVAVHAGVVAVIVPFALAMKGGAR
jgi:thiamine pyrophosphokinase